MPRQTYFAKPQEIAPQWVHANAEGQVLGRLATEVATILMGKHRPEYTPHVLCGDFVIITNAGKVALTGKKAEHKTLQRYSGYPGGRTTKSYAEVLETRPERVVEQAIRRMLPKTRLGRQMFSRLKVYAGNDHPHQAQQPKALELN